jgi:DEAD/DEAH box helicase domain-containing protein
MLHFGILPHHTSWDIFFSHLKFVIIDEMHTYRGVFGSHVANVLRRLKRIANFYGSAPQFILTSATIANPVELAEWLIEEKVLLIDDDGSAQARKSFLIYNPPLVNQELGIRRSALQEAVRLADDLFTYDIQTIIFGRSRRTVELVLSYLREHSSIPHDNHSVNLVRGYRSGYLPHHRREIERGLRDREVKIVVATNALELGIDIGEMGAIVMIGYPGTISATLQQAGRAGRSEMDAVAILIASPDPLDQFLANHPEYLFDRSPEKALINPDNLLILLNHLQCAAFELPFQSGESFGEADTATVNSILAYLSKQGILHNSNNLYYWSSEQYPAQNISLRSTTAENIILQLSDVPDTITTGRSRTIGQVDKISAMWMVHPHAIYLHEAETFLVNELDLEKNIAWLDQIKTEYYTEPSRETTIQLIDLIEDEPVRGSKKSFGEINITSQVVGFRKRKWYTHELLGTEELSLPPIELQTTGYWFSLLEKTIDQLRENEIWGSDPNDYGPDWKTQREAVRARDGYQCQVCGAMEEHQEHDVHHKIPFRNFSDHNLANQLDNLITLCRKCHLIAESRVRIRSGLAGLAFVLRHLAPLFLMCDVRDIGVHSDPKLPLTNGEPAVVIYDQIPAGIGFSQRLFEIHNELLARSYELVRLCECSDGCPSCVGPGGEEGSGGKQEALAILTCILPSK